MGKPQKPKSETAIAVAAASDFLTSVYVVCPICSGMAVIRCANESTLNLRRMTCSQCAATRQGLYLSPSMGLALWYSADTRHGTLYAFNAEHLDYIERYVQSLRRTVETEPGGLRNRALHARLPLWVKSAKNRDEILKAIARMRTRPTKAR